MAGGGGKRWVKVVAKSKGGGARPGEEVPSARAVSICATTSKLFRAINLRQLRSPRAIAGWLLLGGAALSVIFRA